MPYRDKVRDKWRAKVTRSGVRKTQLFETRADAVKWEVGQKELPLTEYLNGTPMAYSLAQWADSYMEYAQAKFCTKVYCEKKLAFREFFKSVNPKMESAQLHPGMLLKHFNSQAKTRSGYAANKDRKNLLAAWNWAQKYLPGWPKDNPIKLCERQDTEKHPRYIPPVEDFWSVYDAAKDGQDKVMLLTYLHTAARRSELFELTWDDVDFENKRLRLWTSKRKGGREFDWIPLTTELQQALESWFESRTFPKSDNVFVCEEKNNYCLDLYGQPFQYRQHWIPKLCEKAEVKPFGFHAIRHLSASILDDGGYPITVIQGILRHKSANTTARYLHQLRGMRVALDEAFKRKDRPTVPTKPSGRPSLRLVKSGVAGAPGTQKGTQTLQLVRSLP